MEEGGDTTHQRAVDENRRFFVFFSFSLSYNKNN